MIIYKKSDTTSNLFQLLRLVTGGGREGALSIFYNWGVRINYSLFSPPNHLAKFAQEKVQLYKGDQVLLQCICH